MSEEHNADPFTYTVKVAIYLRDSSLHPVMYDVRRIFERGAFLMLITKDADVCWPISSILRYEIRYNESLEAIQ